MNDGQVLPYANLLYVSDDPERFSGLGRLFKATLTPLPDVGRFYYDHVNATGADVLVLAAAMNTGAPGFISVLGAACVRVYDNFMDVGHSATQEYLRAKEVTKSSRRYALNTGEAHYFEQRLVPAGACVSGIFDIACDGVGSYELYVVSCAANANGLDAQLATATVLDPDGKQRRGVFSIGGSAIPQTIVYDDPATEIGPRGDTRYGRAANDTYKQYYFERDNKLLDYEGEFGVLKRYTCDLRAVRGAWLYQSANGGDATASYVVDGVLWSSRKMPVQQRSKVATFDNPGNVAISTMTAINSSTPIELSVGADDAQIAYRGTEPNALIYRA